jgi:cyclase
MKRIIFSLLYDDEYFILSRNFKRQKIGDLNWLLKNYDLPKVSLGLDELIIINVSKNKDINKFSKVIEIISQKVLIPVVGGGGIKSIEDAHTLLKAGADKILLNSLFNNDPEKCLEIANYFGKQFIVACLDYKIVDEIIYVYKNDAMQKCAEKFSSIIRIIEKFGAGEIIFQSIDRDGTGNGMDVKIIEVLNRLNLNLPVILKGGIGQKKHAFEVLRNTNVNAICTSNILNFIGETFIDMRKYLISENINLASWSQNDINILRNKFNNNIDL